MKSNSFTTIIIEADENCYLTQSNEIDLKDRIVAKKIALGKNDSAENWKEISKEVADEILEKQQKLSEAEN